MNKRKKLFTGGMALAVAAALLLLPILPVSGQTAPQQAPAQACPTVQSIAQVAEFGLGSLNTTLQSQNYTVTIQLQNATSGADYAGLGFLQVKATNDTTGSVDLFLSTSLDSVSTQQLSANVTAITIRVGTVDFTASPSFAQQNNIPVTSLQLSHLTLTLDLNCAAGTFTTAYAGQTSVASAASGYLGRPL